MVLSAGLNLIAWAILVLSKAVVGAVTIQEPAVPRGLAMSMGVKSSRAAWEPIWLGLIRYEWLLP